MIRSKTRVVFLLLLLMITSSTIVPTMFRVGLMATAHDQHDRVVPGSDEKCKPSRCRAEGPPIKFPFRKREQPLRCGYPGFEVSCTAGDTLIHLPGYSQPLNITYISYEGLEKLEISHDCPEDVLFRLNFSSTPFLYLCLSPGYYDNGCRRMASVSEKVEITRIECSSRITDYDQLVEVSCLSQGPNDHVYVASTEDVDWATLPSGCRRGPTNSIPFDPYNGYSNHWVPYVLDSIYSEQKVSLTWVLPDCKDCACTGGICQFANSATNRTFCKLHDTRTTTTQYSNPFFYNYDQEGTGRSTTGRSTKYVILGVILGVVFIALASVIAYCKVQRHIKSTEEKLEKQRKVDKFLEDYKSLKPTRYSHADIKAMTNYWKTKLGEGGYGTVYEGELSNQTIVAVKVLKISVDDGGDFVNEVGTIGRIHHVNVVRLLGFCADGIHQALVYEFMPNGSLEEFIFSREGRGKVGSWESIQDIATGIAQGIEYLHQGCDQRIVHFDIKPSNILLGQNLEPKISDFGLAKMCSKDASLVSVSAVRGTMGYIAPEILTRNSRNVSSKSDVYSYGMLLLEMVSGRRNIFEGDARNGSGQVYYPEYLYTCLKNGQEMELDASMVGESEIAKKLIIVAMWCIQWFPVNRPSMKTVIKMMQGGIESLEIPPNPFVVGDDTKTENEAHVITLEAILE